MKSLHSLAIESQFHWKSCMMTSGEKRVRMGRARGEGGRPLPPICLGAGTASARGMRERRARNLDIIRECRESNSRIEMWERESGWR